MIDNPLAKARGLCPYRRTNHVLSITWLAKMKETLETELILFANNIGLLMNKTDLSLSLFRFCSPYLVNFLDQA